MKESSLVSRTASSSGSLCCINLPASLLWSLEFLLLNDLIDSGADGIFIDVGLVEQATIPSESPETPKTVNTCDSRLLATITQVCQLLSKIYL